MYHMLPLNRKMGGAGKTQGKGGREEFLSIVSGW